MHCPRCQHENRPQAKFCEQCGTPLAANPSDRPAPSYAEITSALSEALERETATGEILQVISSSPTDIQPVLDIVAERATRLCEAVDGLVLRIEGEFMRTVAHHGAIYAPAGEVMPLVAPPEPLATPLTARTGTPINRDWAAGRAVVDRRTIHVEDLQAEAEEYPVGASYAFKVGHRTTLVTPLMREGVPLGALMVRRSEVRPFTDKQVKLLETFAAQAVIAIENVRLFNETKEALDQQTATSEILGVISRSPTDVQPVFDTIAQSAARLCGASDTVIHRVEEDRLRPVAHAGTIPVSVPGEGFGIGRDSVAGRAVIDRRTVHVHDIAMEPDAELAMSKAFSSKGGHRTILAIPLLREGEALGTIVIRREVVQPFSDKQIELLETFAVQAVIAIENVRLFNETKEALERQTATAEILRVIASSPTDLQPVMEAVAENAARVCGATNSSIFRLEGENLRIVARHGSLRWSRAVGDTVPVRRDRLSGRAIIDRRTIHVEDLVAAEAEFSDTVSTMKQAGSNIRTGLATPLLREGTPLGVIIITRGPEVQPFSSKQIALLETFANQAVIAIENVRLFNETQETLEQQTATSEILRVIASSPTDVQPVFDTIVRSAARLCDGVFGGLYRFDGELIHLAAAHNLPPEALAAARQIFPAPLTRELTVGRAILDRTVAHIPDVELDPEYKRSWARTVGARSALTVPMFREGHPIGTINVGRAQPGPFSEKQIELLKTFADQAVIAIENVRLFTELQEKNRAVTEAYAQVTESLEQQTATAEILRVISSSPTDLQPVMEAVAENAARVCGAADSMILRLEGKHLQVVAMHGSLRRALAIGDTFPVSRNTVSGRAVCDRRTIHVEDILAAKAEFPVTVSTNTRANSLSRTMLATPLLREGIPLGAILIARGEAHPFSAKQIALLETFANQAAIAIENVRLFQELQTRNAELAESLEQQTATGEILRVISRSHTDVQPVFDTIADNLQRLFVAWDAWVTRYEDGLLYNVAVRAGLPEVASLRPIARPFPATPELTIGRCVLAAAVIHIADVLTDSVVSGRSREIATAYGWRSALAAPMLRTGQVIGTVMVTRREAGAFTEREIELIQTFADQAVIAIENLRLFNELRARTAELTQSVAQLTALGEVGRAVSSTLDVDTVLSTIVSRASQLASADGGAIYEYDEATQLFQVRATHAVEAALVETLRAMPLHKGEGLMGRATEMREPIQIADIGAAGAYQSHLRDVLIGAGYRALLSVPLLREDQIIGSLSLNRKAAGEFAPEVIEVLKTFATQSALALQNARLFREIADKSRQLEAASRHKSEFLANMSHELRTPLNAILGFSEVLAERMFGEVNEKQAEYLQDILSSGRHLLSLINDILDLAKVEAGRLELELGRFHLPTALDNALTLVRERATRHGITLTQSVDERLGDIVADERKVKQILLNLLSNAVKFTPEGGRVGLTVTAADRVVTIAVSDTGVGIAPEDQAAIFEEFRQVGRDDTRKQEGTGLGLTLAKKFVELHGGRIWVESQVGQGSTFTFTLPVRPDGRSPSEQEGSVPPRQ